MMLKSELSRELCGELATSESREWLVTNGTGSYGSGTVAGLLTRRYHGLLMAALHPPLGHTLMFSKLDEVASYGSEQYPLFTNRWADGTVEPRGYLVLERFHLEGSIPVWSYGFGDALLEKRIWMPQGENTTYIYYTLRRSSLPITLTMKGFATYRDRHHTTQENSRLMQVESVTSGLCITAFPGAVPLYLYAVGGAVSPAHQWHYGFDLAVEKSRGGDCLEDLLQVATIQGELQPGQSLAIAVSTDCHGSLGVESALQSRREWDQQLIKRALKGKGLKGKKGKGYQLSRKSPQWVQQLVLAADRFIVDRPYPDHPEGKTIIAGYPWFGDWGRDMAIALPGLTLCTGRPQIGKLILQTFAQYVDQGMLPNRFPDHGETPDYNTVDATLWYFQAIRAYYQATKDKKLLKELWPVLREIIHWHQQGTRYQIQMDPADGLLYAGEPGVQLTWMDAKVGEWVVTPRQGKPVEVNALWYNALRTMTEFARKLGKPEGEYQKLGDRTLAGFDRFWDEGLGYCYDVIDTPNGNDASLRPNQIFAVSLPDSPLPGKRQRAVVEVCGRSLLTSYGLRSLAATDPNYIGHYGGTVLERDGAYHQGTVWGWLIGPYISAYLRVTKDPKTAATFLTPLAHHLLDACIGNLSEIFDGDAPMTPTGAFAQAWTVAEVLRVVAELKIEQ